ncbi:hypothetical protein ACQ4PT_047287 [Festuca glaucescens]
MALRSPSSTRPQDESLRDSPPADSPPPTSQGGSSNGAKADVARKTKEEVDQLLVKLEKEGLEINGKIASIIDDGIGRIKAEAAREPEWHNVMESLLTLVAYAVGFVIGVEWQENKFRKEYAKMKRS